MISYFILSDLDEKRWSSIIFCIIDERLTYAINRNKALSDQNIQFDLDDPVTSNDFDLSNDYTKGLE